DQPLADAVAQLGGGGPAEGDEHEVAQLPAPLGDVPGGEGGDGEGLAGAGACLQDGGAAGQRAADVEDGQLGGGVSTVSVRESHRLTCSWARSGSQMRRARTPSRVGSSGYQARSASVGTPTMSSSSASLPQQMTWCSS